MIMLKTGDFLGVHARSRLQPKTQMPLDKRHFYPYTIKYLYPIKEEIYGSK